MPLRRKREESLLFALEESELDQMIAAATKSQRNGVVSINHPVKGHDPAAEEDRRGTAGHVHRSTLEVGCSLCSKIPQHPQILPEGEEKGR